MLTKKQFDILVYLERTRQHQTQRAISKNTRLSVGMVNKILAELTELKFYKEGMITDKGVSALEPYRVQRAIIFAAGFGSRMVPVTLNTPKPLIRVKGQRIIDSLLDALKEAEIEEIYIVRGYLSEQFDQLLYKYPNLKFIENPMFNESNNISSAMVARYQLANAYVCEADLLLYNHSLISKYQYQSNYLGVPVDMTNDWCFKTKSGYISEMVLGGVKCHHMFGISYWTAQDGAKLAGHIEQVYNSPGGHERFWDLVALDYYVNDYKVAVRECTFDDIIEIDTYNELKQIDKTYI